MEDVEINEKNKLMRDYSRALRILACDMEPPYWHMLFAEIASEQPEVIATALERISRKFGGSYEHWLTVASRD